MNLPAEGRPEFLRLPVVARSEKARVRLASSDPRRLGVMSGYAPTLFHLDAFRDSLPRDDRDRDPDLPGAEVLARRLFPLPVHSWMSAGDLARLERLLARPPA